MRTLFCRPGVRWTCVQSGMRWLESTFPERARGWVGFNEPVSHRITAAADILLMPSRFEPCGLNQLYAMRCACLPSPLGRPHIP